MRIVSVIIPVFNGEKTVARAIDSALEQPFDGAVEVVVVNDGSTDDTRSVIEQYRERIKIIEQENQGPAAARNAGVRAAHGDYLAFLDADDKWLPDRFATPVSVLDGDARCVLVYSDAVKVDTAGKVLAVSCIPARQSHAPTMGDLMGEVWNILPSTVIVRRSTYLATGGFSEDFATAHPQCEDSLFWLNVRELGEFHFIPQPTALYTAPSSFAEYLARRRLFCDSEKDCADRCIRNFVLLHEKIRRRYGDRAHRVLDEIRRSQQNMLISIGLIAMSGGNRRPARQMYRKALAIDPFCAKTWVRFAWTVVPAPVGRSFARILPRRVARAVSGTVHA